MSQHLILQIIFLCGTLYGIVALFMELKKKTKRNTYQIVLFTSLFVTSFICFLLVGQ